MAPKVRWYQAFVRSVVLAVALTACAMASAITSRPEAAEPLRLAVDAMIANSGLIDVLAPRFRFKSRVILSAIPLELSETAAALVGGRVDAALMCEPAAQSELASAFPGATAVPLFEPRTLADAAPTPCIFIAHQRVGDVGKQFADWLLAGSGQRALEKITDSGGPIFVPISAERIVVRRTAQFDPDQHAEGEKLALRHCGRCHVVSPKNRYGGIGSTPSFAALNTIAGVDAKFDAFWTFAPHPAFTQIAGMTEPFDPARPSPIAPLELTLDDVAAIKAFAQTIPPADLGQPLKAQ